MRRRFPLLVRRAPSNPELLQRELDDEISSHLAERAEQLERLGMSPAEAQAEAARRFGDLTAARQRLSRSARRRGSIVGARERADQVRAMIQGLPQDARVALRALRRHPAFAVATVATLGLAIAAAVTAFSFVDAIFLRPLPAPAADRLVHVYLPRHDGGYRLVGNAGAVLLRDQHDIFERVAAEDCCWVKFVSERGALEQRYVAFASSDFFPMLGLTPALGRFFLPSETGSMGGEPVVVLNYDLWQRVFDGDAKVLGEHIVIGGRSFAIVGVAPPGFDGVGVGSTRSEIWVPSTMAFGGFGPGCDRPGPCDDSDVLARLATGVSAARAEAGLARFGRALSQLSIGDDSLRRPAVVRALGALAGTQREYSPFARLLGAIAALHPCHRLRQSERPARRPRRGARGARSRCGSRSARAARGSCSSFSSKAARWR